MTPDLRSEFQCRWNEDEVEILAEGSVVAVLKPDAKPGWSAMAGKAGPLAKTLKRES